MPVPYELTGHPVHLDVAGQFARQVGHHHDRAAAARRPAAGRGPRSRPRSAGTARRSARGSAARCRAPRSGRPRRHCGSMRLPSRCLRVVVGAAVETKCSAPSRRTTLTPGRSTPLLAVPVGHQPRDLEGLRAAERDAELARHGQPDEPLPQRGRVGGQRARRRARCRPRRARRGLRRPPRRSGRAPRRLRAAGRPCGRAPRRRPGRARASSTGSTVVRTRTRVKAGSAFCGSVHGSSPASAQACTVVARRMPSSGRRNEPRCGGHALQARRRRCRARGRAARSRPGRRGCGRAERRTAPSSDAAPLERRVARRAGRGLGAALGPPTATTARAPPEVEPEPGRLLRRRAPRHPPSRTAARGRRSPRPRAARPAAPRRRSPRRARASRGRR